MRNRSRAARVARLLALLVLTPVLAWGLLVAAIYLYGLRDEARPADAIVVLGAAQYDGRPSPVLRARLDHAVELYRAGLAPILVTTGGVGPGDTVSEAMVGKRYAVRAGVPARSVLVERTGMTTLQSLDAAAAMLRARGRASAVLVSDPFHSLRLKLLARRVGMRGYTSPTRSSPISRSRAAERRFVLRESFSLPLSMVERLP